MKRSYKRLLGVTLLEIMLVLAIAAMIIIMSIRYYQSASASQQANSVLQEIQAITAAADSLALGSGAGYANTSVTTLGAVLPGGTAAFTAPWGGAITISSPQATSYQVYIASVPVSVCPLVVSKLLQN